MIRLADPLMLLLLLLLPLLGGWLYYRRHHRARMRYSSLALVKGGNLSARAQLLGVPKLLLLLACALIILALARPQSAWRQHKRFTEGIDIMLVLDVSDSMRAVDFLPNRLEKSKEVVKKFISERTEDQIGVVIFGRETFTLCPLTQDYNALTAFVDRINFDLVNGEGTAIGMGLSNAVNKLRTSKARSKVVILLTDGDNNAGQIDPLSAADIAKQFNVRVYTIGVGSDHGFVPMGGIGGIAQLMLPGGLARLDTKQLEQIASETGGKFFMANNSKSLEEIYSQIDKMERTKVQASETHYFDELGHYLMIPALLLVLLAFILENSWLRTFP